MIKKQIAKKMSASDKAREEMEKHFKSPEYKKHTEHKELLAKRAPGFRKFLGIQK